MFRMEQFGNSVGVETIGANSTRATGAIASIGKKLQGRLHYFPSHRRLMDKLSSKLLAGFMDERKGGKGDGKEEG